jgi:hypothetical protein
VAPVNGATHLSAEIHAEIFIDNAITGGEEGEDVLDEVAFVVGHARKRK